MNPRPLIILDPGHSPKIGPGYDPGAVGNGLKEADVNIDLCNRIAALSPSYGFNALIIQLDNETLDLVVELANQHPAAVYFLSIHVNSAVNINATGFESYTYPGSAKAHNFREYVHYEVANFYRQYNFTDRGMKTSNFQVLRDTIMPAMLFENLFISNPYDAAKLKDPTFLASLAVAYSKGIARSLGCSYIPSEVVVPAWAKDAVMWAISYGLINGQEGSHDWYRFLRVLHEYHKLFYKE